MGWTELLIIIGVVALLFGPRQLGRTVGRAAGDAGSSFRDGVRHGAAGGGQAARDRELATAAERERARLLAVLELPPGATPEQIRSAWRDLAKVWHPDRFAHDPVLRARATERLAAINAAHDELMRSAPPA